MFKFLIKLFLILGLPPILQIIFGYTDNFVPSIFLSAVLLWFTEFIPLPATGLLIPTLTVVYGELGASVAFSAFGNQIIFLFIGSFFLAKAFSASGLDRRITFLILSSKIGRKSLFHLKILLSLICWLLSMWISNTATCAFMAPICLGIGETLKSSFDSEKEYKDFSKSLLFIAAFASSIGGMATPVGSPPNLLAMEFLAQKGLEITFLKWMLYGLPVSLVMLFFLNILLNILYPSVKMDLGKLESFCKKELSKMGKIKINELQVFFCFTLALMLWLLPGVFKMIPSMEPYALFMKNHLPMGVVALLSSLILFFLPIKEKRNLNWDLVKDIDWGTILLFGGGLTLGILLNKSGMAKLLGEQIFNQALGSYFLLGALAIFLGIIMSEFSSNTASASIIIPILIGGISSLEGPQTLSLVIACAFGASFGFMLPVSTPPNAIIYGTGKLSMKDMIRAGILFDLLGFLVIYLMVILIYSQFNL